ncbi:hypothetical protein V8C44DRAFT_345304 [Trichoderma aethiopicum]
MPSSGVALTFVPGLLAVLLNALHRLGRHVNAERRLDHHRPSNLGGTAIESMPEESGGSITISEGRERSQLDLEPGDKIVARQRRHQGLPPTIRLDSLPMARLEEQV